MKAVFYSTEGITHAMHSQDYFFHLLIWIAYFYEKHRSLLAKNGLPVDSLEARNKTERLICDSGEKPKILDSRATYKIAIPQSKSMVETLSLILTLFLLTVGRTSFHQYLIVRSISIENKGSIEKLSSPQHLFFYLLFLQKD